MTDYS